MIFTSMNSEIICQAEKMGEKTASREAPSTFTVADTIDNDALPPVVRHAALRGYYMVNKYYTLTDDSIVYRIAMSMSR